MDPSVLDEGLKMPAQTSREDVSNGHASEQEIPGSEICRDDVTNGNTSEQDIPGSERCRDDVTNEPSKEQRMSRSDNVINVNIGELAISRDSRTNLDIAWTISDFFTLSYKSILSPNFRSRNFAGLFQMDSRGTLTAPGYIQFKITLFRQDLRRGKICCRLFLKLVNGTLVEYVTKEERVNYYICDIPKLEISRMKYNVVPEGVLTVLFKLCVQPADFADQQGNQQGVINVDVGKLEILEDSPTRVDVSWTISDFFTMNYQPDKGILSPDFCGHNLAGLIEMDPKGSVTSLEDIEFKITVFRRDVRRGKVYCRMFLKLVNGTYIEYPTREGYRNYFICNIPKLELDHTKDTVTPEGVLTVLFKLRTQPADK